jgi:hypothetical protein
MPLPPVLNAKGTYPKGKKSEVFSKERGVLCLVKGALLG